VTSFPLDYGYPYGIGGGYFFDTFILQMHYVNPNLESGIVDNSGVIFGLTTKLRKFNISTLTVGSAYSWQGMALVI
jgi:hypothetical protein